MVEAGLIDLNIMDFQKFKLLLDTGGTSSRQYSVPTFENMFCQGIATWIEHYSVLSLALMISYTSRNEVQGGENEKMDFHRILV